MTDDKKIRTIMMKGIAKELSSLRMDYSIIGKSEEHNEMYVQINFNESTYNYKISTKLFEGILDDGSTNETEH